MTRSDPKLHGDETFPLATAHSEGARWLIVVGDGFNRSYPLPATGVLVLGRAEECHIAIADRSVSRVHAELDLGPPLRVRDLGSHNGVRVRDRRLGTDEWVELAVGESIQLGTVLVTVRRGPASSEQTPAVPTVSSAPVDPGVSAAIVADPAMRAVYETIGRVAAGTISVLLLGETGVGKEVVAEAVHRLSPRAARPLLRLNCAALAPTLLESELFGHERGAFTGAPQAKPGLLETADKGTVFLDEVGELPMPVQVKLLRVLEERKVLRVGGLAPRPIDVRFVAATHRDLRAEVARGTFRQDLYFRLNGVTLVVPPLRERRSEIAPLARRFAALGAQAAGRTNPPVIAPETLLRLERYSWPGNVRELRNAMERAVLLCGNGPVLPAHLPTEIAESQPGAVTAGASVGSVTESMFTIAPPPPDLRGEVEALERQRIIEALAACSGNQTRAAQRLGMKRGALVARLDAYGIPRPRKGQGE